MSQPATAVARNGTVAGAREAPPVMQESTKSRDASINVSVHSCVWNDTDCVVFGSDAENEMNRIESLPRRPEQSSRVNQRQEDEIEILGSSEWLRKHPLTDEAPPMNEIRCWNFDVLRYSETALMSIVMQMFDHYDLLTAIDVDEQSMRDFVTAVIRNHDGHEYHNCYHAVATMHCSFLLLSDAGAEEFFDDLDIFAILFGALVHDVDHKGNNNDFEVKTKSELAVKHSNESVLENHSIDVTFNDIVAKPELNIFRNVSDEDLKRIRDRAAEAILATDPGKHSELTKDMIRATERTASQTDDDDGDEAWRSLLSRAIVHAADLSSSVHRDRDVVRDWCMRISVEFRRQAQNERNLGVEVTPYMDGLEDETEIAKNQICFYNFMVLPLYKMLTTLLPKAGHLERTCGDNVDMYREYVGGFNCGG